MRNIFSLLNLRFRNHISWLKIPVNSYCAIELYTELFKITFKYDVIFWLEFGDKYQFNENCLYSNRT
jgi:hypothetical protein